jgi:hypothetical protein
VKIDLDDFRVKPGDVSLPSKRERPRRPRAPFIRGPLPVAWWQIAAGLTPSAIRVALSLWHLSGLTKSRKVRPNKKARARFGLTPHAARRGLAALEAAGLVEVRRAPGQYPTVTILETAGDDEGAA